MQYLAIFLAAAAAYGFGALWYTVLANPWKAAAGMTADKSTDGRANPKPYVISAVCMFAVAAMMQHIFTRSGVDSAALGVFAGFGLGFFIATPWIATNYAFSRRPVTLTLIDGGYASIGCALMGLVLGLF